MTFPTKSCGSCRIAKPLNAFYKSDKGVRGRSAWCIKCHIAAKARRIEEQAEAVRQVNLYHSAQFAVQAACGGEETRSKGVSTWLFVTSLLFNLALVIAYATVAVAK